MTVVLTAPITEAEYRSYPLLALPTDFTGDPVTTLLNQAWDSVEKLCNQPLSQKTNTDLYDFPSKNVNATPAGIVRVVPRYSPLISVTSVSFSQNIAANGWVASVGYDVLADKINVYDSPFERGSFGMVKVVYVSGYATIPDSLKKCCTQMATHMLSGGFYPTQAGAEVISPWLTKDFWKTIDLFKRVF